MTTFILSYKFRQNIVNFNESMPRIAFFMLWKFQRKTDQMHVQMKLAVLARRMKPETILLIWRGELLGHELFPNLVHMLQKFYVS